MTEERVERRLAAILAADVVGYSRLVGADETGALTRLRSLRRDVIEPNIASHSGRLFKIMGDGFFAEFPSAVQAISCALAIQKENEAAASRVDGAQKMMLRIGIHIGDVIVEGDDLMGDGVNIAARLESITSPGGIFISRAVHDQVRDRLKLSFDDLGEVALKNIARPVPVFAVAGKTGATPVKAPSVLALPDKPSIAVLPFQNMSGDPEQEYFADGMVQDIITALSRFKALFVIARNSTFIYKGKAVDIKQVGRDLGVRYVLEGSVRKAAGKVRITGQLIDATTGTHLWADRFEGSLEDVFELQDQVTTNVIGAVAPTLERAEMDRANRKPVENLDAYDCLQRGMASWYLGTRRSVDEALAHFYRAIELDHKFSAPYGLAARCYIAKRINGWSDNEDQETIEVERVTRRAIELGKNDSVALCWSAAALSVFLHEHDAASALVDLSLSLNPNLAAAWRARGNISSWTGYHDRAIDQFQRAIRLNPLDPETHHSEASISYAYLLAAQYDMALLWAARSLARNPRNMTALRVSTLTHAHLGQLDEAKKSLRLLTDNDPTFCISSVRRRMFFSRPEDASFIIEGFQRAGLRE